MTNPAGWRWRGFRLKLRTDLPELSWWNMPAELVRSGVLRSHVSGDVRLDRREGYTSCCYVYETPLGEFRGRFEDGEAIERICRAQLEDGVYDHPEAGLRPGDYVLDVGAHLGLFTALALERGAAGVIGIEADPDNADSFRRSHRQAIEDDRARLVHAAAWNTPGTLEIIEDEEEEDEPPSALASQRNVRALQIDQIVEQVEPPRIDFVRIGIGGGEANALAGARRTIAEWRPRMAVSSAHGLSAIEDAIREAAPEYTLVQKSGMALFHFESKLL